MFKHCLNPPLGTEFYTWILRVVADLLSLAGPLLWLAFLDVFICTFTLFHNCVFIIMAEKTKLSVFGPSSCGTTSAKVEGETEEADCRRLGGLLAGLRVT